MKIRPATDADIDGVWEIFRKVVSAGDTYVFDPDTSLEEMKTIWFGPAISTYVCESDERILGTYILKPNQPGLGSHIANAAYMVHPDSHGEGFGSAMCDHSIAEAKDMGYKAMQFNIVVSTNDAAIGLWKKFGFRVVGTIPEAFNHSKQGFVDAFVMYRKL